MPTRNYVIRLLLTALCTAFFALTAVAADPSTPLSEEDVALQQIKTYFDVAFLKAEFDKDGDLKIEEDGMKTFVKVDKEKKLITFFSLWGLKESVSEIRKLQLVNTMNNDLIFVRFSMINPTTLFCDYQLLYEGGITPFAIVNNYRHYRVKERLTRPNLPTSHAFSFPSNPYSVTQRPEIRLSIDHS